MGITQVEKRAVIDSARSAGAREVRLVSESIAAIIGAGLDVTDPVGHMVAVIGGGTSEVAIVSLGGIVRSRSIRVAGDAMTAAIVRYVHDFFHLDIDENTAEEVKKELGSAVPLSAPAEKEISGKDSKSKELRSVRVTDTHVREALAESIRTIGESVLTTLEETSVELVTDLSVGGLLLAGGGALIRGLDTYLAQKTNLPVVLAEDPLTTVVKGAAAVMRDPARYRYIFVS